MKFLCDRCRTRYSIGDDRVRGKILKIRCKNCANVITVREGMSADGDAPEHVGRTSKPTTGAPTPLADDRAGARESQRGQAIRSVAGAREPAPREVAREAPRDPVARPAAVAAPAAAAKRAARPDEPARSQAGSAKRTAGAAGSGSVSREGQRGDPSPLGAAFASAMAKPPPALEEEWYVSIDGDQAGPFSLAEAQRWVTQKPFEAELHCWSEGFDDWLSVDKVSHFRGLRKRPQAPPPLPRIGGAPQRAASPAGPAAAAEDEPKPLFAATMASLERGAVAPSPSSRAASPRTAAASAPNGARAAARDATRDRDPGPAIAVDRRADNGASGAAAQSSKPAGSAGPASSGARGFDTSEGDSETEATLYRDRNAEPRRGQKLVARNPAARAGRTTGAPASQTATPVPAAAPASSIAPSITASAAPAAPSVAPMTLAAPPAIAAGPPAAIAPSSGLGTFGSGAVTAAASDFESGGHGDELDIGEVSRVVNLADIMRPPRAGERAAGAGRSGAAGAIGRMTGQNPSFRSTAQSASLPGAAADADPAALAPAAKSHRHGLIALLSVAAVMVLGVVGAVILLVTTSDESTGGDLGPVHSIDTSRPEDPITHRPIEPNPTNPVPHPPPRQTPRSLPPVGSNHEPDPGPTGNALTSDEIEDAARKHQDVTFRCYLRAQRGADSIIVGEVKKIAVTLTVDKDGNVSELELSEHGADNLGKCLLASIKGWKFRPSSGGTFRFSLNFAPS